MNAHVVSARRTEWMGLTVASVWVLTYFAARFALEIEGLSQTARLAAALAPMLPFVGCLVMIVRGVASLDELQRRIHFEALAVAFPLTLVLLMTLGLLDLAMELPKDNLSYRHIWPFAAAFYFAGLVLAKRRYR